MEQIIIKDGVIVAHIDAKEMVADAIAVASFGGAVGTNIGEYDDNWELLPLSVRVEKGYVKVPSGYKVGDKERFVEMTKAEKIAAGEEAVPYGYIVDGDIVRPKTSEEKYEAKEITKEEYTAEKNAMIISLRRGAYAVESDPVFFEEQRGAVPPGTWEAKVAEIKMRYPKEI